MHVGAETVYRLHGLKISYFTGKLEAYFRAKGIGFEFVAMDVDDFRRCAEATGIRQMPQVELADGTWLTDTTDIIAQFEAAGSSHCEPSFTPSNPPAAYLSLFLEDVFDEWLWRPALYYRWAFGDDRKLMSAQIVREMMGPMPGPDLLKRWFLTARQRRVFLKEDGVTRTTAPQVEALFLTTLDLLDEVFSRRPYLFGARPSAADFGLFGPMFRHFSNDPTPLAIMRERAPYTLSWVSRLWAARPEDFADTPPLESTPDDLGPLISQLGGDYLVYLEANAKAFETGASHAEYAVDGVAWRVPVSPYRVRCLADLSSGYGALEAEAQRHVEGLLGRSAPILKRPTQRPVTPVAAGKANIVDRRWR